MSTSIDKSRLHAMTCDVEDYFQVSAFEGLFPRSRWSEIECRIPRNIDKTLELLDAKGAKGTFFTLGWVATNFPKTVRDIVAQGHEVASHGMQHVRVWSQEPHEFLRDASDARKLLEDVSGERVTGYRAASWSIDDRTPWAHDILAEAGYKYSSSIYPVSHDHFGMPEAPPHPNFVAGGALLEVPASTSRILGRRIPSAGGGYFRLYPLAFSRYLIQRQQLTTHPHVFYFHPWELDPDQPRVTDAPASSRFRHYLNLHRFENRLSNILDKFSWGRMDRIFLDETP